MPILNTIVLAVFLLVGMAPDTGELFKILGVALGSGSFGALIAAWGVVQFGTRVWNQLAGVWSRTEDFEIAVQRCAAEAIRLAIEEHDDEPMPHSKWRHDDLQTQLAKVSRSHWEAERGERGGGPGRRGKDGS